MAKLPSVTPEAPAAPQTNRRRHLLRGPGALKAMCGAPMGEQPVMFMPGLAIPFEDRNNLCAHCVSRYHGIRTD